MCRMLEVTRQGCYEWKKRPVSAHDQKDARAGRADQVPASGKASRTGLASSGSCELAGGRVRHLRAAVRRLGAGRGPAVRAYRAVSADDRAGQQGGRRPGRPGGPPVRRPGAGPLWVSDITYIWTSVWFRVPGDAARHVLDKVVGWAVDDHMRTGLVLEALDDALAARRAGNRHQRLVAHHDRGSQYTSGRFHDRLFAEVLSVGRAHRHML